jgi:hypothetical protein
MAYPSVDYRGLINRYSDIEHHKACIANELRLRGFSNVINHSRAVTCLIEDHTVVIMHLRIDQYQFYEVVVIAGPDYNKISEIINRIWRAISVATNSCTRP